MRDGPAATSSPRVFAAARRSPRHEQARCSRPDPLGRSCAWRSARAALVPAAAGASAARVEVIVQMDAGALRRRREGRGPRARRRGDRRAADHQRLRRELSRTPPIALEDADGVKAVTVDAAVKPQGVSLSRLQTAYPASVDAPQLWNYDTNVTGKGVGVAVIDTGIAGGMPDFRVRRRLALARDRQRRHQPGRAHAGRRLRPRHARRRASSPATAGTAPAPTRCAASTSASRPTRT